MRKSIYKPGAFLAAVLILSAPVLRAQDELTKQFHQEYTAQKGNELDLSNRYGHVVVETSQTDKIVIDVKVTIKYPNREKAQKLLGYIDVKFAQEGNIFSAKTILDDKFNFTGWFGERSFSIDYNVKMPEWLNLSVVNRYGNTDLADLSGCVKVDVKYGNLNASKLSRGKEDPYNSVAVAYGNATIDEAGWIDLNVRYCGNFSVNKAQAIMLDSKYSKVHIGTVSSVVADDKYDNLRIESINNLVLDGGYTDINIGTLNKKLKFDGGYGGFNVERVPAGFESIEIDTDYTGVRIGIDETASYRLSAKTSYCGLKYNEAQFHNEKRIVGNTSSEVSGVVGTEASPAASVIVNSSYGNVKLL